MAIAITVWYGLHQRFGHQGNPQRWINIIGSVTPVDKLSSLTYQLNEESPIPLIIGPDGCRLIQPGDFNAEIPRAILRDGINRVLLTATSNDGEETYETVEVHYTSNTYWPLPYHIDWRSVSHIQDVVHVIDGEWRVTTEGIRPVFPAYDRLITLGDVQWTDYCMRVAVTVHGFIPKPGALKGGFGILLRWSGHYADGNHPSREWRPNGAIGWYRARWEDTPATYRCLNISDAVVEDRIVTETPPIELALDTRYIYQFSVQSRTGMTSLYRYQVWPENSPESLLCDLVAEGHEGEASHGSILLIALSVDVTIGNISIKPM